MTRWLIVRTVGPLRRHVPWLPVMALPRDSHEVCALVELMRPPSHRPSPNTHLLVPLTVLSEFYNDSFFQPVPPHLSLPYWPIQLGFQGVLVVLPLRTSG